MKSKKIAAIALAGALTLGVVPATIASASGSAKSVAIGAPGQAQLSSVLATLVTNKTITQAQADAILAALKAAMPAAPNGKGGGMNPGMGPLGVDLQAIVLKTLGIDAAALKAARDAGKSLAQIDPTKTTALINALVAATNSAIDAAVTAGKLTAAQATTMKANVTAKVTEEVNEVPGTDRGGRGPRGGKGGKGGMGGGMLSPSATSAPSIKA